MSTALADAPTAATAPSGPDSAAPLGRRWITGTVLAAFLLTFSQSPGLTVADTKYDLAQNPLGFLRRAAHLWSSQAPMGQVQNQAYGYFFPHGSFFALGHALGLPAWVTQRIWWALLILATVAMARVGGLLALLITGTNFSVSSSVGRLKA